MTSAATTASSSGRPTSAGSRLGPQPEHGFDGVLLSMAGGRAGSDCVSNAAPAAVRKLGFCRPRPQKKNDNSNAPNNTLAEETRQHFALNKKLS
eukprot:8499188-Lingulodinium_polyedra.AAC.1